MTAQPNPSDRVLITAKRLDSDEVAEAVIAVKTPESEIGQRGQLAELVASLYPNAEFRSFANDAATFLDHKLLIVAIYQRAVRDDEADEAEEDDSQQRLFAA